MIETNTETDPSRDIKSREARKQASGREPVSRFYRSIIKLPDLSVPVLSASSRDRASFPRFVFIFPRQRMKHERKQELAADVV